MAAPTISMVGYNPADPNGSQDYMKQMLAAQLREKMAEEQMASGSQQIDPGQYIPGNSLAPGRVVPVNPLANLAKALQTVTGAYGEKKSMEKQIALQTAMMGRQFGAMKGVLGGAGSGSSAAGTGGGTPGEAALQKAYMAKMMGAPDEVVKGIVDYGAPTPDQKNAGASGVSSPLALQGAEAQNTANAGAGVKVTPVTLPDGTTKMMTDLQQVQMAGGSGIPPISANVPNQPTNPARGSLTASEAAIPTPPQEANISTNGMVGGMPLSGDANTKLASAVTAQNGVPLPPPQADGAMMAPIPGFKDSAPAPAAPAVPEGQIPGFAVQNPSQKEGLSKDYQNFSDYKNKLNDTVTEGAGQLRIINAQEDFAKNFKPGAGETTLTHLATVAKSLGASDNLVNMISRGDPGSVEAFDSLASQHAARQAEMLLSGGGTGTPRISQAVFESFKNDLSDPNKQANATAAINALTRQQYQDSFNEQQALLGYKGDPLKFRQQYAQGMNKTLMDGRSADPSQAIKQGAATPPVTTPPPLAQRTAGMIVNSPQGPVKWTGTGWMRVQNAQ